MTTSQQLYTLPPRFSTYSRAANRYHTTDANTIMHFKFNEASMPIVDHALGNDFEYSLHGFSYPPSDHSCDDHGMFYRAPGAPGLPHSLGIGGWNMEPFYTGGSPPIAYPPYAGRKSLYKPALTAPITIPADTDFVLVVRFYRSEGYTTQEMIHTYGQYEVYGLFGSFVGFQGNASPPPPDRPWTQAFQFHRDGYYMSGGGPLGPYPYEGFMPLDDEYSAITLQVRGYNAAGAYKYYSASWRNAFRLLTLNQWNTVALVVDKDKADGIPDLYINGYRLDFPDYPRFKGWYWDNVPSLQSFGDIVLTDDHTFESDFSSGNPGYDGGDKKYPFFGQTYDPFYWQEIWWQKGTLTY